MMKINSSLVLVFSSILRVLLIIYGEWQDTHMEVRYTDVDYFVFSDAAALMAKGKSPYERSTYRYSPLLALLLIPNHFLHRVWGKTLFSIADILVGRLILHILNLREVRNNETHLFCMLIWLMNPFTFTIGTRGNCEPIVSATLLWIIACLLKGKTLKAAFWYGLVVHFRVYPIVYALPILVILNGEGSLWRALMVRRVVEFSVMAGGTFFLFTGLSFYLYAWEFLNEALLYHLTRTDHRHNFSVYFYHVYLQLGNTESSSVLLKLSSFLPQFSVQLILIRCFSRDLTFCFFVQTAAFVALNKVITAQYFVWFFTLLPLIVPWSKMRIVRGLVCVGLWVGSVGHWLMWAYQLEFKGKSVFLEVWMASVLFMAANSYVLSMIIINHSYSPLTLKVAS